MSVSTAHALSTPTRAEFLADTLEPLAARAVPPSHTAAIGDWRLRFSPGVTSRRANSILTVGTGLTATHVTGGHLGEWLDDARAFYASRGLPLRLQMSPATNPGWLDAYLARHGFNIELPGSVMVADVAFVASLGAVAPRGYTVTVSPSPSADWLGLTLQYGSYKGADEKAACQVLERIEPATLYATAYEGNTPIGNGMAVLEAGWLGIFSLATHPLHRRRGICTSIVRALVGMGQEQGAHGVYLQVSDDNVVARQLYEHLGFEHGYGYHYRTLVGPLPASESSRKMGYGLAGKPSLGDCLWFQRSNEGEYWSALNW